MIVSILIWLRAIFMINLSLLLSKVFMLSIKWFVNLTTSLQTLIQFLKSFKKKQSFRKCFLRWLAVLNKLTNCTQKLIIGILINWWNKYLSFICMSLDKSIKKKLYGLSESKSQKTWNFQKVLNQLRLANGQFLSENTFLTG